jgi:Ran GTPase-activating protein (RanGAP) involved in mRNA processing and transport
LRNNRLGPEGGAAIAEALKHNKTVKSIEYVPTAVSARLPTVAIATRLRLLPTG